MSALSDAVAAVQTDQQSLDAAVQALTNAVQNDEQASDAAAAVTALQGVSADLQAQAEAVNTATAQLAGTPSTPPASSEAPATPA